MTNAQLAQILLGQLKLMTGPVDHYEENVLLIKQALDEAEKRGAERMRERAAKEADLQIRLFHEVPMHPEQISRSIRALPIEGE